MKTLVVEDDFTSRLLLQSFVEPYGEVHIAVDGEEALEAYRLARDGGNPFDLICLDIMMPGLDGQQVLRIIRDEEGDVPDEKRVNVVMITALDDPGNVTEAFASMCQAYLVKPLDRMELLHQLHELNLIPAPV